MKQLNRGQGITLGLALIAAGLAAQPVLGAQAAAPASKADQSSVSRLREAASGTVDLRSNPATGRVGFARAEGTNADLMPGVAAEGRQGAIAKASAYLDEFAPAFGARAAELKQTEVYAGKSGWSITFAQSYKGVPVFAGELKAHVDTDGDLTAVNGFVAPGLSLDVTPRISQADASAKALEAVKARPAGYEDGGPSGFKKNLEVRKAELVVYRTGSPRGIDGDSKLAWAVEVWNKKTVRETLILDAATGKPLNRWSMMADALDRALYEASLNDNGTPTDPDDDTVDYDEVYVEGDDFPGTLDQDQQNEVLGTGEAYWLFRNSFGYNAWDGQGGQMITVNNDPTIDCPNANWNGVTTNYCSGVTGDDTVAHEWGHAYTESTSGLIYQWQAGAMNEAYSDIWGETVDMLNNRMNEVGEPNSTDGTVYRTPGTCSDYTRSLTDMTITAPASIAGPCVNVPASFGPVITQTGVDATAVVGTDAANADGPTTTDGCSALSNAAAINGNWVYVDRGTCTFATKIANAEDAGATGIVVGNTPTGALGSIAGESDLYGVMVSNADGTKFKNAGGPVSFHIAAQPGDADPTHRWLSGESDPAFGGAIRDMWNPNCYGDPGKVSDEEYVCGDEDSGGVHTNSGVVNRTFALLVDGMDGQGTGIGLDKAGWLFWHTQTNYLTPTSYFPDLADGLEASCEDLQGVSLEELSLGNPQAADGHDGGVSDPEVIAGGTTEEDCAMLADVIDETELRLDPSAECAWQPLLKPGAPALSCGAGTTTSTTWSEDFEDGLAGWTQDQVVTYPGGSSVPWEASTSAPKHTGGVAYGPDPQGGSCSGAAGDLTSRNGLISPAITVPAGTTPRIQWDHYMASEAKYDGGNVKVSVNGGAFTLVPASAYLFNAPAGTMDAGTKPMANEAAWTGTDGGQVGGSWGTSIIDLGKVAKAGDTVMVRFDMGRDGCGGVDGWYVDNVKVQVCATPTTPTPTPTPTPEPEPVASKTIAKVKPKTPTVGEDFKVIVKVKAKGEKPEGKVVVRIDGVKIATKKLDDGRLVVTFKDPLRAGKHRVTAAYKGSDTVKSSRDELYFRIVR
ncbi:Zn-dependent metalloprotease [Nocardioides sp. BE266]|uniref:M4 family metallopeptidase n=1 Tax=Nocardioides sp. BE266 TaxID=2817725 RepID=UPI002857CC55|nr:M4 family metallopeptidase [Nocardioides sp. BE266]MDR7255211.1 Zn-dependent metalloprotease [Nocardioides sp. BE266]